MAWGGHLTWPAAVQMCDVVEHEAEETGELWTGVR